MEVPYINTDYLTRGRLDVTIVRVESPLLFWVQLKNSRTDLLEMEEELQLRMQRRASSLSIFPEHIKEDMDVVVKDNNIWRRGFVKSIDENAGIVHVTLGDWGRIVRRRMADVYRLEDHFKELSWQALICGLAHTTSPNNGTTWPRKTRELCRLLLEGQEGWINIVHPLRTGAALVKLHMKNNNKFFSHAYNFRDALVRLGHADITPKLTTDIEPAV